MRFIFKYNIACFFIIYSNLCSFHQMATIRYAFSEIQSRLKVHHQLIYIIRYKTGSLWCKRNMWIKLARLKLFFVDVVVTCTCIFTRRIKLDTYLGYKNQMWHLFWNRIFYLCTYKRTCTTTIEQNFIHEHTNDSHLILRVVKKKRNITFVWGQLPWQWINILSVFQ